MAKRMRPDLNGKSFRASCGDAAVIEAAGEGEGSKLPKFSGVAYTGGAMDVGWGDTVVVDLAGMTVARQTLPMLLAHENSQIVGHSEAVDVSQQRVKVSGVVSGAGQAATEVTASSRNGFPWQMSIGATSKRTEFVQEGEKVKVNGKNFEGPIYVVRASVLTEISFVPRGADGNTSASVAAQATEENAMTFEQWLASLGIKAEGLDDKSTKTLKASWNAEYGDKTPDPPADPPKKVDATAPAGDDPIAARRKQEAEETTRIAAIRKVCAGKHAEIEAKAISEGWNVEKAELEVIRAERPKSPAIHTGSGGEVGGDVLECALAQAGKMKDVEKTFKPETLQAAHTRFRGRIGLRELIEISAAQGGYVGRGYKHEPREVLKAAFSTLSLPGILGNTANKFILEGYTGVDETWRMITKIKSVSDFKAITSYRLTGAMQYEKIGPDGQIQHGTLGEQSFTNQAETYALMLGITRTMLINDDLSALTDVPRMLGRGAALKMNDVFWTEFFAEHTTGATLFPTNGSKGNYQEGAGTVLSITSLSAAIALLDNQTDADSKPLGAKAVTLLVPPALKGTAWQILNSVELRDTTASTKAGTANPHAGMYSLASTPYLQNASYGNSAVGWYLLCDPAQIAFIEGVFLNGQEAPTVETAEANFNELGIQMRGYHDFGFNTQDYRAAVKSKGSA